MGTRQVRADMRTLIAIPVYNEQKYVQRVLERVLEYADDVLVIDDGSSDMTPLELARHPVEVIRHASNRGYGRSLQDAFRWAAVDEYDWIITMDCDEQHEPASIPAFMDMAASGAFDVISGSRYLEPRDGDDCPPPERRAVNLSITDELNERLGLVLTDAFCGFKAYRVGALQKLRLTEPGYAFPLQFWVQAVAHQLRITEIPVRLIYNDLNRSFGGPLDDRDNRLRHYREVMHCELERQRALLPPGATTDLLRGCCG